MNTEAPRDTADWRGKLQTVRASRNGRDLIAGIGLLVTLLAGFCGFFTPGSGSVIPAIIYFTACLNVVLWIIWKQLPKLTWLALIACGLFLYPGVLLIRQIKNAMGRQDFLTLEIVQGSYSSEYFSYSGVDLLWDSIAQLFIIALCSAMFILIAEGLNWLANRPRPEPPAPSPTIAERRILKQIGTANDGSPLFENYGPAPQLQVPATSGTNLMAVLALVFGIIGGIVAIPLGHIALYQIRKTGENGRGLSIAGLILGYLWLGIIVIYLIFIAVIMARLR